MDILIIVNIVLIGFIAHTAYLCVVYGRAMGESSRHHLISHGSIVFFFFIALNIFVIKGWIVPLIFVLGHIIQHVIKENLRLVKTGTWTPEVKDDI